MFIIDKARTLIGNNTVATAPDLVVALSEAVLHAHDFLPTKPDHWTSPGLPNNTHVAKFKVKDGRQVEVKWTDIAGKLMVFAAVVPAEERGEPVVHTAQLNTTRYITEGTAFPLKFNCSSQGEFEKQLEAVVSGDALAQLTNTVVGDIVRKIIPTEEEPVDIKQHALAFQAESRSDPSCQEQPSGAFGSTTTPGRGPGNPLEIGRNDLEPLGGRLSDPASGGMVVGPGHSMFRGEQSREERIPAGPSFLPPGAVPAGARFDPIGPFGGASEPARPGGRFGGGAGGPFGGGARGGFGGGFGDGFGSSGSGGGAFR
ncbi:hypothetical protein EC988_003608 [Linderina pennispora]|nr:hypothetical protein EC988_003608 [Linderina pennispora]